MKKLRDFLELVTKEELFSLLLVLGIILTGLAVHLLRS